MSKQRISNVNCCVYGCHQKKGKDPSLSFHNFPSQNKSFVFIENKFGGKDKIDKYKAWMIKLKMGKPAPKRATVCSLHFSKNDFILPDCPSQKRRLKSTAVPSRNLPVSSHTPSSSNRRKERSVVTKSVGDSNLSSDELSKMDLLETEVINFDQYTKYTSSEKSAVEALLDLQIPPKTFPTNAADKCIQVASGDFCHRITDLIVSKPQLITMTGLPSFEILNSLVDICTEIFKKRSRKHSLTLKDTIIFTFMKLKTGMRYSVLSVLFNISKVTCRTVFHETLTMLAKILQPAIYYPSLEEVKENMPKCFEEFQNVRIVVDCTEIPVEQVRCLCCRLKTYSQYKKRHTLKFMTAVSPAGLITYVSKAYGGRSSDKEIFKQSLLIESLEMYKDHVMVDKGFLIQDIAAEYGIKVIQPPFLKKKIQFTKEEALLNAKIAKARVHVERANQRIKMFEILNKTLPYTLISQADNIFTIICAIVNLSNPIFTDEKFL